MTPVILTAIQRALNAQFEAGKAVGALEYLMTQNAKPAEAPVEESTEKP